MKKFFMFFMLSFVLVLGACGNGDDTDTVDDAEEDDDTEEVVEEEETDDEVIEEEDANEAIEEEEATDDDSAASDFDAESFARTNCVACHGTDFTGQMGPDIVGFDEDALKEAVREGPGSMPSYPESQISDEELDVLATYFSEM